MPVKLNVGVCRKVGEANFGSRGASINLEAELDASIVSDQHRFKEQVQIGDRHYSFNFHKAEIETSLGQIEETGGLVILVEDRTELDTLEAELSHAERLASIGRFAAGVAHEIGNPLTGIDSIAQNMQYEETRDDMLLCARDIRQ